MNKNNVVEFKKPAGVDDPVTEVLRQGARQLLDQAIEAEVEAFMAMFARLPLASGHRRVVRNGYLPEREIQTGIGAVAVKTPRVRDKAARMRGIRCNSAPRFFRPT